MQIVNRTEGLVSKVNITEQEPSDDLLNIENKFTKLLKSNIETNYAATETELETEPTAEKRTKSEIPDWVDLDYGYDPSNPRKPNMRELMEALSGKDLEELYNTIDDYKKISRQASEMLYGVIGSNQDTRDWLSIMASENILIAAQQQTGVMFEPEVDIQSNFNDDGFLTEQIAVIKDNKGNTLRSLSNDTITAEEELLNFGATKKSIPTNLEEQINPEKFDANLLNFLKNFDNSPTSVQQLVVQNASEAIANKISQEIPLDELAKL